jgi:hypothetical protein
LYDRVELALQSQIPLPALQQLPPNLVAEVKTLQEQVASLTNRLARSETPLTRANKALLQYAVEGTFVIPSGLAAIGNPTLRDQLLGTEQLLQKHMPELYTGEEDRIGVMDFLDWIEYFIQMDGGFGTVESDICINVVFTFITHNAFKWVRTVWAPQNNLVNFRPPDGSFGKATMWSSLKTAFIERSIMSAMRLKLRAEWEA